MVEHFWKRSKGFWKHKTFPQCFQSFWNFTINFPPLWNFNSKPFDSLADITPIPYQIFVEYIHVWQILIIEWIILQVIAHTMKCLEVVRSLTISVQSNLSVLINKPCSICYCANFRPLHLLICTHVPKHTQFALINNTFKSIVVKIRIIQTSELTFLKKKCFFSLNISFLWKGKYLRCLKMLNLVNLKCEIV